MAARGQVRAGRLNSGMGAGYVGILTFELHFPESGSLKGKRKFVKSAKAQLQNRLGAAVAEADHAGDPDRDADDEVRADRARRRLADVAQERRQPERAEDQPDEAAEEADERAREDGGADV